MPAVFNNVVPMSLAAERRDRAFLGVTASVTGRRWADRLDAARSLEALAISQSHGLPDLIGRVLAGRGVDAAGAASFLAPTVRDLMPDPSALTDMDRAAERIADAVVAGEAVAIFGDYDVDGAASAALMTRFLRVQGIDPRVYIPDRLFEGYGPTVDAVRRLHGEGARLLILVDCGTTSHAALEEAAQLGLGVVVIDHHQAAAELPLAAALVNPQRTDDLSGLGHLAAAGLTFMAVVATNRTLRRRGRYAAAREPDLLAWLDLVALATVCDVVPLAGLNRAFVARGLEVMRRGANPGLAALARTARLGGRIMPQQLGFLLGPRINAGGRIGDASLGARLLSTDDPAEAEAIAVRLDALNQERQAIETTMLAEAMAEAEAEVGEDGEGPAVLVTQSAGWHPGVVGLAAARLKERFRRPAFAIAVGQDGMGTGSGRSVAGVDLGRAVRRAVEAGLLAKGGGHAMAAGITIDPRRLGAFRAFLQAELGGAVRSAMAADAVVIDGALTARAATVELVEMLARAGPFGSGNPDPVFAFPAHAVVHAEVAGHGHLRLTLAAGDGARLKAIAFRAADQPLGRALAERRGEMVHVAGTLAIDEWQMRRSVCLRVRDAAPVRA